MHSINTFILNRVKEAADKQDECSRALCELLASKEAHDFEPSVLRAHHMFRISTKFLYAEAHPSLICYMQDPVGGDTAACFVQIAGHLEYMTYAQYRQVIDSPDIKPFEGEHVHSMSYCHLASASIYLASKDTFNVKNSIRKCIIDRYTLLSELAAPIC